VIFETERLFVRDFAPADFPFLFKMYSDPEMREYFPEGVLDEHQTREELEWFLNGGPPDNKLGLWAVILKTNNQFVGRAGLLPWDIEGTREIEIAYMIGKSHWRQGLGSEIANGLVSHGFEVLDVPHLIALTDKNHIASIRTAQSAGLEFWKTISMDGVKSDVYKVERQSSFP